MNNIYLLYLKFKSYILDNTNIKQSVFFGLLTLVLLIVSFSSNHAVKIWSSLFGGFAFGIFLIKLQPIINYFKGKPAKGTN